MAEEKEANKLMKKFKLEERMGINMKNGKGIWSWLECFGTSSTDSR
jgi:hypothetical protein